MMLDVNEPYLTKFLTPKCNWTARDFHLTLPDYVFIFTERPKCHSASWALFLASCDIRHVCFAWINHPSDVVSLNCLVWQAWHGEHFVRQVYLVKFCLKCLITAHQKLNESPK